MQCYWLCCWLDAAVQDCLCQRGLYLNYAQRLAIALPLACCHDASACQLHGGQCLQACRTSTLHRQCIAICSSMTLVRCCRCQQTKPTLAAQAHCLPCQCIAICGSMTLVRCCRCQQTKPTQAAQAHCLPCQCITICGSMNTMRALCQRRALRSERARLTP